MLARFIAFCPVAGCRFFMRVTYLSERGAVPLRLLAFVRIVCLVGLVAAMDMLVKMFYFWGVFFFPCGF